VFVDLEQGAGLNLEGELGLLLFDMAGELVAEYLFGVRSPVETDVGVEQKDLIDKKLGRAEDRVLVLAQIEKFGQGVGDGFFGEEIDQELFDGQRSRGVDEAVDLFLGDTGIQDREFFQFVGTEGEVVVQQCQQMGQGIVVDVEVDLLSFLRQDGDPVADIGLEEAYPYPAFFVRETCLKAAGIGGGTFVGVNEVVVGRFVGQFDEGIEFFFGDLFVPTDDEEIGPAKQGGLVEIAFGLIETVLVMVESQQRFAGIESAFVEIEIVVDHVVILAVEEDGVGEVFVEALVKFALVHVKKSLGIF